MAARKTRAFSPARPVTAGLSRPATWQTRISDFAALDRPAGDALLSSYTDLYGTIQRKLFAQISASRTAPSLKGEYLRRYRIPGRMFNSVRVSLEGKLSSVREQQLLRRDDLQRRIARAQGQIARVGVGVQRGWLHQKQRRLGNLKDRLEKLESDIESGRITALLWFQASVAQAACPGGQRLFQPR